MRNMPRKDFSAIVLAGGKSTRMGQDKAFLPFGDERLIDRVIARLLECFSQVIVVGASGSGDRLQLHGVKAVADEKPGMGPMMGILSGLKASATGFNFVMACDIPDLDHSFLKRMLAMSPAYDILVPRHGDGRHEPLFAVYHRRVIPLLQSFLDKGIKKIDLVFPHCRQGYIDLGDDSWLVNINTPRDYAAYAGSRRLRKQP